MKRLVQFFTIITLVFSLSPCSGQDKQGKIKIEITKEINGEKKTFKGEYETEEQMKADPNYQEFAGKDDGINFWFGDGDAHQSLKLQLDQLRDQSSSFFNFKSFDDNEETSLFFKHLGGDSAKAFRFGDWDDQAQKELMEKLGIELESLKQLFGENGESSRVLILSSKRIKVVEVEGDEFGEKGEVSENKKLALDDLTFFPNPSTDGRFKVRFSVPEEDELNIKVFDLEGKQVYNRYFESFGGTYSESIDLSGQSEGIYLLEISQGKKRLTKKIVIN